MKATIQRPDPAPQLPTTVTIELSEGEAAVLNALFSGVYGIYNDNPVGKVIRDLEDALADLDSPLVRHACFSDLFEVDADGDYSVRPSAVMPGTA